MSKFKNVADLTSGEDTDYIRKSRSRINKKNFDYEDIVTSVRKIQNQVDDSCDTDRTDDEVDVNVTDVHSEIRSVIPETLNVHNTPTSIGKENTSYTGQVPTSASTDNLEIALLTDRELLEKSLGK